MLQLRTFSSAGQGTHLGEQSDQDPPVGERLLELVRTIGRRREQLDAGGQQALLGDPRDIELRIAPEPLREPASPSMIAQATQRSRSPAPTRMLGCAMMAGITAAASHTWPRGRTSCT